MICWLLHRKEWLILLKGSLPWNLDAVKFCFVCDEVGGGKLAHVPAGA